MISTLEELVTIPAAGVRLQGHLAYPSIGSPSCAVLIMGAHPLLGGNMANNVTTALRLGLAERGAAALTFDYRRPTTSMGTGIDWSSMLSEFWHTNHVDLEPAWRGDAGAAMNYLRNAVPVPMVLIGYSFGCWSLADLADPSGAAALVCISPNPTDHDLERLRSTSAPLLVLTSDNDFSCTPERLSTWNESLCGPKELKIFSGAEHFFRGREVEVVQTVVLFLQACGLIEG